MLIELVTPSAPVNVPAHFLGMHVGVQVPAWKPDGNAEIPAPTYGYGYARNLKVEVDGEEERGFWSNIETSPGVYDWSYMDKWMSANTGHPVVWLIYGTPTFYQLYEGEPSRYPSWLGIASPPTEAGHAALEVYAQSVIGRYGSQIVAFEVWDAPTLPWTGDPTSFDDRWTPEWGTANSPLEPAPFFSGSASELANIAYTLSHAGLNVPILGAGFADQSSGNQHTVTRFLDAPVTLPGGSGTGKDHIQGLSFHFADHSHTPVDLLAVVDGYRSKLGQAGVLNLPLWETACGAAGDGVFSSNDPRAPVAVLQWTLLGASKGLQSLIPLGHVSEPEATERLGDPVHNSAVIASLAEAFDINGRTICNAAVLVDGRVWVTTDDGVVFLK